MTLSISQCIEVAEKVWGWKTDTRGKSETLWRDDCGVLVDIKELREAVLSWQGFGRTVEGMAKRGLSFQCLHNEEGDYYEITFVDSAKTIYGTGDDILIIKATHLAALEAKESEG